jgi:hypothetical protein
LPGSAVRRASGKERDAALYFDKMEKRLPIGLGRDGRALYANLEFIDGTRGAHVNISGISGVATKTSFATWLLYSVFRSGVLGGAGETANTRALIFNVKGEDLLFLDHPNRRLDDKTIAAYARLGLVAQPFDVSHSDNTRTVAFRFTFPSGVTLVYAPDIGGPPVAAVAGPDRNRDDDGVGRFQLYVRTPESAICGFGETSRPGDPCARKNFALRSCVSAAFRSPSTCMASARKS